MLTEFGRFTRKLRVDRELNMKTMANMLHVSTAHLSLIEHGQRNIPEEWRILITEVFKLSGNEICQLNEAITHSILSIRICLTTCSNEDKELIVSLINNFNSLSELGKKSVRAVLNNRESYELGRESYE